MLLENESMIGVLLGSLLNKIARLFILSNWLFFSFVIHVFSFCSLTQILFIVLYCTNEQIFRMKQLSLLICTTQMWYFLWCRAWWAWEIYGHNNRTYGQWFAHKCFVEEWKVTIVLICLLFNWLFFSFVICVFFFLFLDSSPFYCFILYQWEDF